MEEVVSEVENEVVNKEKHKDENMGENEEESGDEMAISAEYEATFEPGNWRFSNLLDYRRTFRWENDKEYTTPIPEVHPIASSLTDSIPSKSHLCLLLFRANLIMQTFPDSNWLAALRIG